MTCGQLCSLCVKFREYDGIDYDRDSGWICMLWMNKIVWLKFPDF